MNDSISKQLKSILDDRHSGSTDILLKINKLILSKADDFDFIETVINQCKKVFSHFHIIIDYLDKLDHNLRAGERKLLNDFISSRSDQASVSIANIFNALMPELSNFHTAYTLSNSRTLIEVFKLWKKLNSSTKVIVSESRPVYEGRLMAEELASSNIKVELVTEAMAYSAIEKVDFVVIGADNILADGSVVNKTGSNNAAIISSQLKKPFYVLASKEKYSTDNDFITDTHDPNEIYKAKSKNIKIRNNYFELVDRDLITKIITD